MAEGKWISDLSPSTPLVGAARRVLEERLDVVRHRLPEVIAAADQDPEPVHQLRVGTRRARAALRIFAPCLPEKVFDKIRKELRRIRRAAGAARDWDVFLASLSTRLPKASARQQPGLDFLLGYGAGQRDAAQGQLLAAHRKKPADWEKLILQTVQALHEPAHGQHSTLRDLACPHLSQLIRDLEEAAGRDLQPYPHLHRVRILGKRLRYAMEIFACCHDAPFREVFYPAVEEMQEILGQANDSHEARCRLADLRARLKAARPEAWPQFRPGIEGMLRHHQRRLLQQRRKFEQWWQSWKASGAENAFARLLSSH